MLITLRYVCAWVHTRHSACLSRTPDLYVYLMLHFPGWWQIFYLLNKSRIWRHCCHHDAQDHPLLPAYGNAVSLGLPLSLPYFFPPLNLYYFCWWESNHFSLKPSSGSPSQNWSPCWPSIPGLPGIVWHFSSPLWNITPVFTLPQGFFTFYFLCLDVWVPQSHFFTELWFPVRLVSLLCFSSYLAHSVVDFSYVYMFFHLNVSSRDFIFKLN